MYPFIKRLTSSKLAFVAFMFAALAAAAMPAWADDPITGPCGDNVTYTLTKNADGKTYTLTINGTGAMEDYTNVSDVPWYIGYGENITAVVVSDGVTHIGNRAFVCYSLESVELPSSLKSIGVCAFCYCFALKTITLPASVTEMTPDDYSGALPFDGCAGLTAINVDAGNPKYSNGKDEEGNPDGVLYELNGKGEPVTLLLCPLGKKGTITVPATVTSFAMGSFYNKGQWYTSLSGISFAPRDPGTVKMTDKAEDVFGESYAGDCVLYAPEGMRINNALSIKVKDVSKENTTFSFRKETAWDGLQDAITKAKGSTFTLTDSINYKEIDGADGVLEIPANTTLDLNNCELTAYAIYADGDLTVRNGTLKGAIMTGNEAYSTLKLEKANVEATAVNIQLSFSMRWNGALALTNSAMTVKAAVLNMWMPPEKGPMLTMDGESTLDVETLDLASLGMAGIDGRSFMTYGSKVDGNAIVERYNDELAGFLPAGYQVSNKFESSGALFVTDADGKDYGVTVPLRVPKYAVKVENGTLENGADSGSYAAGATVIVKANAAPSGKEFDKWTSPDGVTFKSATSAATTFTMPAKPVTVTANYKTAYVPEEQKAMEEKAEELVSKMDEDVANSEAGQAMTDALKSEDPDKQAAAVDVVEKLNDSLNSEEITQLTPEEITSAVKNKEAENKSKEEEKVSKALADTKVPAATDLLAGSSNTALKEANEKLSVQPKVVEPEVNTASADQIGETLGVPIETDITIASVDKELSKQTEAVEALFNEISADLASADNSAGGKGVVIATVFPRMRPHATGFFPLRVNLRNLTPGRRLRFWPSVSYFRQKTSGKASVAGGSLAAGAEGDFYFLDGDGNKVEKVTGDASKMTVVPFLMAEKEYSDAFITADATSADQEPLKKLAEVAGNNNAPTSEKDGSGCDGFSGSLALLALIPMLARKQH